jgi:uncharacterized radical SAM superfamily Fe-S cluster-containing enzyme
VLFEVTQRCNLSCPVCYADAGRSRLAKQAHAATDVADPPLEAIAHWYDALRAVAGLCHIQISGGEPTLRDDLEDIIRIGRDKGFSYFQLNTNGILLGEEPERAQRLKEAGLTCVFLQFDGLDDEPVRLLRGRALREQKLAAIDACAVAGLPVVLVCTLAGGVNEHELMPIVEFGVSRCPVVRGVHVQPLASFGRSDIPAPPRRMTIPDVLALLEEQSGGMISREHFSGGTAENPYCSFNANYLIDDEGRLVSVRPDGPSVGTCCGMPQADAVQRAQDTQARRWGCDIGELGFGPLPPATLDGFLWRTKARGFSLTGMAFMDAETMDFDRLRRCYIFVMDADGTLVPFCAYNLSSNNTPSHYRAARALHHYE